MWGLGVPKIRGTFLGKYRNHIGVILGYVGIYIGLRVSQNSGKFFGVPIMRMIAL